MRGVTVVTVAVLVLSGAARASVRSGWVVRDLGALPRATTTEALAVNDRGDMVGWSNIDHAFLWRDGRMHDLGAGYAIDVNEHGQVLINRDTTGIARLWQDGRTILLRPEPARGSCLSSLGRAVNESGVAVGWTAQRDCNGLTMTISWQAARWAGGTRTLLSARRQFELGDSEAVAVNNRGQILINSEGLGSYVATQGRTRVFAGHAAWLDEKGRVAGYTSTSASKRLRAYLWSDGKQVLLKPLSGFTDSVVSGIGRWGDLNFTTYFPRVIDDAGDVVGVSQSGSADEARCRAVMWSRGRVIDLIGFSADFCVQPVVNGAGEVAGTVTNRSSASHDYLAGRAFVWENGRVRFLPTLGGTSSFAGAINARGDVVGSATTRSGSRHAVIWTRG